MRPSADWHPPLTLTPALSRKGRGGKLWLNLDASIAPLVIVILSPRRRISWISFEAILLDSSLIVIWFSNLKINHRASVLD